MFKSLFLNKKRSIRNFTLLAIAFLLGTAIPVTVFMLKEITFIPWIISISTIGSQIVITSGTTVVLAYLCNKHDSKLRNRYIAEANSDATHDLLTANGVNMKTTRTVRELKGEMKKLATELYHAHEREKNLKLVKKF